MIKDRISNAHRYDSLHPNFHTIFEILQAFNLGAMEDGHIELDGNYVYINVKAIQGKDESCVLLESHRSYIDIHIPLSGSERFGLRKTTECQTVAQEYDSEKDTIVYSDRPAAYEELTPGEFVVFFPDDAHASGITPDQKHRKLVVKVSVEPNREKPTL